MNKILMITCLLAMLPSATALSPNTATTSNRRHFFQKAFTIGVATAATTQDAFALDMDAFMNNAIQQDAPKQMSDDERSCKYSAPGRERGEACERAGMSTAGKGKGVDAYGNIDRGDFVRCKTTYPMIDGQYVKTVICS